MVRIHTEDFKEIARFLLQLKLEDDETVYTDVLTRDFLEVYSKGRLPLFTINYFPNTSKMPEKGILVKDGSRAVFERPAYHDSLPEWCLSPPAHWPLLYTVRGKEVEVYEEFDPKIYRILPQN